MCDLDGTLIDTETCREEALKRVLVAHNASYDLAWHPYIMGRSMMEGARFLVQTLNLSVDPITLTKEYVNAFASAVDERGLQPLPHVDEVLRDWHAQGVVLWIVSGANHAYVVRALKACGWSTIFTHIVSGDPPMPAKPDPALFQIARDTATATRLVAIEDAPAGIASAKAAGLPTIGLVNTRFVSRLDGDKQWFGWRDASLRDLLSLT